MGEISVKTGNNARNGGKNSLNRLIRCVCGKKIGPDPRNFNQRVSLGRNDLLIRTFPNVAGVCFMHGLDEGEGTDDVSILSKEGYNKRWEHYTTNNVFDLIEEREVIC
ncbi:hypothetical protein PX972_003144 [Escherichia coli]|nr:hypothetical protein [Escherichia coli]EKQ3866228.1 hypothetical protein [Escherichia coli]ELO9273061.1 hypothetical protein [Escherichia coli]